eukprot:scaffold45105_cov18-Tisochrysis_lutea.AAC.1
MAKPRANGVEELHVMVLTLWVFVGVCMRVTGGIGMGGGMRGVNGRGIRIGVCSECAKLFRPLSATSMEARVQAREAAAGCTQLSY